MSAEILPVYLSCSISDLAASSSSVDANWAMKSSCHFSQLLIASVKGFCSGVAVAGSISRYLMKVLAQRKADPLQRDNA